MTYYEIHSDDILREARRQKQERLAQTQRKAESQPCGRFAYDSATGEVAGPAEYMKERYSERMNLIYSGRDTVFNMGVQQTGNAVQAVLVSLQTDFAAWLGMKMFDARS